MTDSVKAADNSTGSGANILVLRLVQADGTVVEIQGVGLVDANGNQLTPMTNDTGLRLLRMLEAIDAKLAKQTGTLPVKG